MCRLGQVWYQWELHMQRNCMACSSGLQWMDLCISYADSNYKICRGMTFCYDLYYFNILLFSRFLGMDSKSLKALILFLVVLF